MTMQDGCVRSKYLAVQAMVELGHRPRHLHFPFHLLLLGARMQHDLWHDDLLLGQHGHLHFLFHLLLLGARLLHDLGLHDVWPHVLGSFGVCCLTFGCDGDGAMAMAMTPSSTFSSASSRGHLTAAHSVASPAS